MTATSVLTPSVLSRSWTATQRALAVVFVVLVFSVLAFTVGRASVHSTHTSPPVAPLVSRGSGTGTETIRRGRAF